MDKNKAHINPKAATCTVICMLVLGVLMFLFGFKAMTPIEESGMLINFGDTETGSGQIEPRRATPPTKKTPPPPPKVKPQKAEAAKEEINTQDFEEAAAIEAAKKKEKERKKQERLEKKRLEQERIEKERIEQERLEKERLEQERLEKERLEKERQEREAKAEAIRQQTSNAFGKSNSDSQSQGTTQGSGNQGSLNGSTTSNGNGLGTSGNWSLAGRSLQGSLPKPNYKIQKQGTVVVEITVDRNGKVISATPILRGSTTQDAQLWKLAQEAAIKARFNANPTAQAKQIGTITYKFVLN